MNGKKVSLICTVFNEERNIKQFLDSIISQTVKPKEVIIVDGGSKDKTFKILKEYSKKYSWITVYQVKGASIAEGRNFAIERAKGEIIFTSDSSTYFEKDWIKKILKGFNKGADVVFGKYHSNPKTLIERFLVSRLPAWEKVDEKKFIPSNRHVAFRKEVWERVGKFPPHIKRADDNWFHSLAHKQGFKYKFVKEAQVFWLFDRNLKNMIRLAFLDSKSEGFTNLFLERKIYLAEIALLFLGLVFFIFGIFLNWKIFVYPLVLGVILFSFFTFFSVYKKTKNLLVSIVGIPLMIILYFSHVTGVLTGMVQRVYKKKE